MREPDSAGVALAALTGAAVDVARPATLWTAWQRLFRYDFFISYAWADGRPYAEALVRELAAPPFRYRCFIDRLEMGAGAAWRASVRKALRRSSVMVLVGSPRALESDNVFEEVRFFAPRGRPLIPISFASAIEALPSTHRLHGRLEERLRIPEEGGVVRLARGEPSQHVLEYLHSSFGFVRVERVRTAVLVGVAATLLVLTIIALSAGWLAEQRRIEAEHQRDAVFKAQIHLLTDAAAAHLRAHEVRLAENIILNVLSHHSSIQAPSPEAVSVFQESRAIDLVAVSLSGHRKSVTSAAYSPEGARIVTASNDGTARIWDAATGIELVQLVGTDVGIRSAQFSPGRTQVLTASADGTATLWDAATGQSIGRFVGHSGPVNWAAFSADGSKVVTGSDDETARIWDAKTFQQTTLLVGHVGAVMTVTFSPNGERVLTASTDKTARVWDSVTGAQVLSLKGHSETVWSAAFSPNGKKVVTASQDKTARVWDASEGTSLGLLYGHLGTVHSAAFSPDGTQIVTASYDKTVRVWDARTLVQLSVLSGHLSEVLTAVYSPDGTHIVSSSQDRSSRIWCVTPPYQLKVLSGHDAIVTSATYSPHDARIVTSSGDNTARIWDAVTAEQVGTLSGHTNLVDSAAYSPDGSFIVTGSYDDTARIWDARTFKFLWKLDGEAGFTSAVFSPDGQYIATGSFDMTARVWSVSKRIQTAALIGHHGVVRSVAYAPDGNHVVTSSDDKTARVWDASNGSLILVLSGHGDSVRFASYSPDGRLIVTASNDKTARIWDANTGKQLFTLYGHLDVLRSAAFSPDGDRIVTAGYDKTVRLWDAVTATQLAVLPVHGDGVRSAFFSTSGQNIVAASLDGTATVWASSVSTGLDSQLAWMEAATFDPLTASERTQLGILRQQHARMSSLDFGSECDRRGGSFYDPNRHAKGVAQDDIVADEAIMDCSAELTRSQGNGRLHYQLGRVLRAKHSYAEAERNFEAALAQGYQVAGVDLADLLVQPDAHLLDPGRAISLYETAVQHGIWIAAFKLGQLYEVGLARDGPGATAALSADLPNAWHWYQKGKESGESYAIARFALRDEQAALLEKDKPRQLALLLQAFVEYSAASRRAEDDCWPDEAWRHWRFRRATIARLLARDGMMQQIAASYRRVTGDTESYPRN